MLEPKEQLKDLVEKGLRNDIFEMEQAYFLIRKITNKGKDIDNFNNGTHSYLFREIQSSFLKNAVMSVSRIYDQPSKKYPTRCLLSILNFIKDNSSSLPLIIEKPNLKKHLYEIGVDRYFIDLVDTDQSLFGKMIADYFMIECFTGENENRITRLKNLRDKRIGHNEQVNSIDAPTLLDLKELIDRAKKILGVVGWSYLGTVYIYENKYFLSEDAKNCSLYLEKLFKDIGI